MFNRSSNLLIFIGRNGLEVYAQGVDGVATLEFPPEIISHSEVRDEQKYQALLQSFFTPLGIKNAPAVVVLSDSIVFYKEIENPKPEEAAVKAATKGTEKDKPSPAVDVTVSEADTVQAQIQSFYELAPYEETHKVLKQVATQNGQVIFVANKMFYQSLEPVLTGIGCEITTVVPASFFNITKEGQLDSNEIGTVLQNKKVLADANLLVSSNFTPKLTATPEDLDAVEEPEGGSKKWLIVLGLLVFLALLGGGLYYYLTGGNIFGKKSSSDTTISVPSASESAQPVSTATESGTPTDEASKSSTALARSEVTISVLNGSGVSGQAAKVKEALVKLGYQAITTGNAPIGTSTVTTVTYDKIVPSTYITEIESDLALTSEKVITAEASSSGEFAIEILIGTLK